jgi:hypothetical protein
VYSPLSYGKNRYSDTVEKSGRAIFGNDFYPVRDFMPYNEYLDFLYRKDVAVFNHKRQQALGNIVNLLGMGKIVFLRKDIATWDYMGELGLKVFDVYDISKIETILETDISDNVFIIKKEFCLSNLVRQWKSIFVC